MLKAILRWIITYVLVFSLIFFLMVLFVPSDKLSDGLISFLLFAPAAAGVLASLFGGKKNASPSETPAPDNHSDTPPAPSASTISKPVPYTPPERGRVTKSTVDTKDVKYVLGLERYAVVDVETTGLSRYHDKIIEIGIVTVDGDNVSTYTTYINPEMHIPIAASRVNGIYDKDVADAPTYADIAPIISEKLDGLTLIAHNASFDMSFIENLFIDTGINFDLVSLDTLSLSRRHIKDLPDYKLTTLIEHFNIDHEKAHRAGDDAYATMQLFECIRAEIRAQKEREKAERKAKKEREAAERKAFFSSSPLYDISFVFTGDFETPRHELEDMVLSVGALKRDAVTGKTNYLVVGDLTNLPDWALGRKLEKAKELNDLGKGPKIINEEEYLQMINSAISELNK